MGKGPLHNGSAPQGLIQFVSMEEYLIVKTHLEQEAAKKQEAYDRASCF
jgi:hypothetical protein